MDLKGYPSHPLAKQTVPLVFGSMITGWPASKWTPDSLADILGKDTKIRFRVGPKSSDDVVWETKCCYEDATVLQFLEWLTGGATDETNPLLDYRRDIFWCYADYKYMAVLFKDKPELLKSVDWSVFGLAGRTGQESTLWVGSEGAYTPCHYDTYGCNLVAQIHGRKRWVLFPPSDTRCLYPTRLPYEESSVFSDVNIMNPDLTKHPNFSKCQPYVVTLEPGQVLFVPRHWWHLVESLEPSISINSWIEMDGDDEGRLQEAAVRMLVTSMVTADATFPLEDWLNPTEDMPTVEECKVHLKTSWKASHRSPAADVDKRVTEKTPKRQKLEDANIQEHKSSNFLVEVKDNFTFMQCSCPVESTALKHLLLLYNLPDNILQSPDQLLNKSKESGVSCKSKGDSNMQVRPINSSDSSITAEYFLKCVTHPDVISLICQVMNENKAS